MTALADVHDVCGGEDLRMQNVVALQAVANLNFILQQQTIFVMDILSIILVYNCQKDFFRQVKQLAACHTAKYRTEFSQFFSLRTNIVAIPRNLLIKSFLSRKNSNNKTGESEFLHVFDY